MFYKLLRICFYLDVLKGKTVCTVVKLSMALDSKMSQKPHLQQNERFYEYLYTEAFACPIQKFTIANTIAYLCEYNNGAKRGH